MAGGEAPQAVWREAGKWWEFEPYREVRRWADPARGLIEEIREAPSLGLMAPKARREHQEDRREEWSLRERKIRDEKVAAACGQLPQSYHDRQSEERRAHAETAWSVVTGAARVGKVVSGQGYAPLHCLSGYAFGRSVMLAEEIATLAALGGCPAAALTDPFSLAGALEFDRACRRNGLKPLLGASFELPKGGSLTLIARSKLGFRDLSRLVSACHLGEPRGFPLATWERLAEHRQDLFCLTGGDLGPLDRLLARRDLDAAHALVRQLVELYGRESVFLEVERSYLPWQRTVEQGLVQLAERWGLALVAGGAATHARREHFPAQDVLVCVDTLCLIDEVVGRKPTRDPSQPQMGAAPARALNAERFLRAGAEMRALYADRPEWLRATLELAERCDPEVLPARTRLPSLFGDDAHALREIVELSAPARHDRLTPAIRRRLEMETKRICGLGFASHFLIAFDMVRWAGEQGIHFSGRGSVVDSAVAFVLGLSRVDAIRHRLHFDRFLPEDGNKRPDIDLDFEARRRDEVRGYLTRRYGQDRVATVAAMGAFCTRGIVREVGKVFGLPEETISFLAKKLHGGVPPEQIESALEKRPELRDHNIPKERFRWALRLAERLQDVPRNLRCHSSGVVICAEPIVDTVPVQWGAAPPALAALGEATDDMHLRVIQWDKRSAKHVFDKFDVLCLRGQDVLSRIEAQVRVSEPEFKADKVGLEDPETYRAFRSGELIGVPQSASPAMRQAHIRLQTENLEDASLVQAGIRPGVGGAVKINELIARRRGLKSYSFLHPKLEEILGHTYGIIVFQEQVDQLLQAFCGCTGGEAEDIRDAIHKRRREDYGAMIKDKIIGRILSNGHSVELAQQVFDYIAGFKGYGFAQGHALAFAEISIRCVSLMQNHPAEYFAALLSSQPAGYYGPCTLANEARSRGVRMLRPCVNRSRREFCVEEALVGSMRVPGAAIRTGWMQVGGLSAATVERVLAIQDATPVPEPETSLQPLASPRQLGRRVATAVAPLPASPAPAAFSSFFDFVVRAQPERDELEALILAGAFDSVCPHRRALLWAVPDAYAHASALQAKDGHPCLPLVLPEPELPLHLPDFDLEERAAYERSVMGMDVDQHLMAFERARIAHKAITTQEARRLRPGERAVVVGNPIRLRFPPTPSGKRVVFFDLEDESGLLNVTCFDRVYQRDGKAIVTAPYVTLVGEGQDRDGHTAFLAHRVFAYRPWLLRGRAIRLPVRHSDYIVSGEATPKLK